MRFADIACGSGSFLLGVYDLLIRYHTKFYNENPAKAKKGDVMKREGYCRILGPLNGESAKTAFAFGIIKRT
jgi:hypothetical protein